MVTRSTQMFQMVLGRINISIMHRHNHNTLLISDKTTII